MNINRHNYEEFFLLLADGELSTLEQDEVLAFAKLHPDLAEELDLLMDCRLEADFAPVFPKEKLLKPTIWNLDEPSAIQSQLLNLLDNELEETEKKELEDKIAAEVSLKIEWDILSRATMPEPETGELFPKEKLLKPTIWNIDQPDTAFVQMMSLLDNELPASEKAAIEKKIQDDKVLAIEWKSLQQVKLIAENVVFEDKASLYREKENRRIVPWMRWAAAAAILIGFGLYLLPKINSKNENGNQELANNKTPSQKSISPATEPGNRINTANDTTGRLAANKQLATIQNKEASQNENTIIVKGKQATVTTSAAGIAAVNDTKKNRFTQAERATGTGMANGRKKLEQEKNDPANTIAFMDNNEDKRESLPARKVITVIPDDGIMPSKLSPARLGSVASNQQASKNNLFRTASYNDDVTQDNTADDNIVYVAGARINKQKVRGIFRGITRSLGRTFTKSKVEPDQNSSLSRDL